MASARTRIVCGIQHRWHPEGKDLDEVTDIIPIAGELKPHGGYDMDAEAIRLSTSDSTGDHKKTGLRLVLKGGKHKRKQKAVIEFLCKPDVEGTEGEWEPEEKYDAEDADAAAADILMRSQNHFATLGAPDGSRGHKEEQQDEGEGNEGKSRQDDGDSPPDLDEVQLRYDNSTLIFDSRLPEGEFDVLRLTWYTKHACENAQGTGPDAPGVSPGWGFFTWLVVM